jgi:hypothetical protein
MAVEGNPQPIKVCSQCKLSLGRDSFSKKQWGKKPGEQRCKACIILHEGRKEARKEGRATAGSHQHASSSRYSASSVFARVVHSSPDPPDSYKYDEATDFEELISKAWQSVPGFEGLCQVRCWKEKVGATQSWCYVPLIVSALRHLPSDLPVAKHAFSTSDQIAKAQCFWKATFSNWEEWVESLRQGIVRRYGSLEQCKILKVKKSRMTTSMVFSISYARNKYGVSDI